MSQNVNFEQGSDFLLRSVQECLAGHDARVVHQHRDVANLATDFLC